MSTGSAEPLRGCSRNFYRDRSQNLVERDKAMDIAGLAGFLGDTLWFLGAMLPRTPELLGSYFAQFF